jgi:hypothetical protein
VVGHGDQGVGEALLGGTVLGAAAVLVLSPEKLLVGSEHGVHLGTVVRVNRACRFHIPARSVNHFTDRI